MMNMKRIVFYLLLTTGLFSCRQTAGDIDLSGEWAFAVDSNNVGIFVPFTVKK
jgi:hypothetical protein